MATATAEYGVSSPEVKVLQQNLNKVLKQCRLKEDGSFDEETAAAVAQFQAEAGLPQTGKLDAKTAEALEQAVIPRTEICYQGKAYWLTKEEFNELKAAVAAEVRQPSSPAQQYLSMTQEVRILWDAHNQARKDNQVFAWIIEGASGANFPSEGMIAAAEACAQKILSAASDPKTLNAALQNTAPIRAAFAAMDQYREELFGGGDELVRQLETIRDGCVVLLEITAALATGGASWTIQAGVAAGVGSYKALLGELDKASRHDAKQTISTAIQNVVAGGAIDATVAMIMKGPQSKAVIEAVAKAAATKVSGQIIKECGRKSLAKFVERAIEGGSKKAFEELVKDLLKACNPNDKTTFDDAIGKLGENFAKGAVLQQLDGVLGQFAKGNASKMFSQADFKGMGDVKYDEALKEGLGKYLELAYDAQVNGAVEKGDGDPSKVEKELKKAMVADANVRKWFADYEKKQGKKKK
jgi:hypothetical protein